MTTCYHSLTFIPIPFIVRGTCYVFTGSRRVNTLWGCRFTYKHTSQGQEGTWMLSVFLFFMCEAFYIVTIAGGKKIILVLQLVWLFGTNVVLSQTTHICPMMQINNFTRYLALKRWSKRHPPGAADNIKFWGFIHGGSRQCWLKALSWELIIGIWK